MAGHDRGTVVRNQSDYNGKLRLAGPPADGGIADQTDQPQQGPLFPIGPHLAAFRSPPKQHANPDRPQVYLLSFVSHEAQGPTKKLYELADRHRQEYAQCHSYGMIRENLDTISAYFFKFLLREQETCRINLGPYFKNGKSFIRLKVGVTDPFPKLICACLECLRGVPFISALVPAFLTRPFHLSRPPPHPDRRYLALFPFQVFALWKHLTSQEIPEGSWLWFLDGDAVITNFTSGVLEHVRSVPTFQAQFEEFKGALAKDPSIFMAAHSVKPWKIDIVRCLNSSRPRGARCYSDDKRTCAGEPAVSQLLYFLPPFIEREDENACSMELRMDPGTH